MINVPCTLLESMVVLPGLLTDDDAPVSNISGIAHAELDGTWFMRPYVIPAVSPPQFTSLICVVTITIMSFVVGLLTLQQAHGQSLTPGGLSTCGHMSACCLASLNMLMAVLCLLYFAYRVFQCDEDELIAYSDPRNPLGQNCFDSKPVPRASQLSVGRSVGRSVSLPLTCFSGVRRLLAWWRRQQ